MSEFIYFVDSNDKPTGEVGEKLASHTADTKLHAAFSCYIFSKDDRLLVTQRAFSKKVWPGVWTNSVCGHPAPDEARQDAITRRAREELGMELAEIKLKVPKYIYKTPPFNGIIEYEFCPIYFAKAASQPKPNPAEVAGLHWVTWDEYKDLLAQDSAGKTDWPKWMRPIVTQDQNFQGAWSWWCKDQLKFLNFS